MVIGYRFSVKRFLCNDLRSLGIFQGSDQLLQTILNRKLSLRGKLTTVNMRNGYRLSVTRGNRS